MDRENFKKEVATFRSQLKEDAVSKAEQSFRLEKKGPLGYIALDQFQEKANILSSANMLRLFELFTQVEADKENKALIIISKKPSIFVAGADISEIKSMSEADGAVEALMKLQSVFTYLENIGLPTIAAIHGACMGGGLELALSCRFRIATDAPETKLALPEVLLGLIPGWGGTQRLPKLVGLEKSLDLILTGKALDAKRAKKIGLVDKVVSKEFLDEKVVEFANQVIANKGHRESRHTDLKEKVLSNMPGGKWVVLDMARKQVLSKTKGNYPAPLKALEVIGKTYGGKTEPGLKVEAAAFAELVKSPESANLIGVYYLNEKVKKDKGTEKAIAGKPISHAGVLGAGIMGGGIAQLFAAKNVRVRMKDISWEAIAKGNKQAHKIFQKLVDKRRMKPSDMANAMARIEGTTEFTGFKQLDLVVEAVVENLDVKKKIFAELEKVTSPTAVLATNTSSLSVDQIASAVKDPTRVVGMHFFNPVDKMPLVEVIRGKHSTDEAVATVFQFAKKLGKTPIVVKDSPGFIVNRLLDLYLVEAVHLLSDGLTQEEIDRNLEAFGMPMGPCELIDEIGIDVCVKVAQTLYGAFGARYFAPPELDLFLKDGRLGKKNGKGAYLYEGKKKTADPTLMGKISVKKRASELTDEIVVKRLIYIMINEAGRCIEEGIVRDVSDIDVGMIFGSGFAPFRGGLLRYADSIGAENIVSDLELLTRTYGERFKPSPYLQQLAVSGKKFYQ